MHDTLGLLRRGCAGGLGTGLAASVRGPGQVFWGCLALFLMASVRVKQRVLPSLSGWSAVLARGLRLVVVGLGGAGWFAWRWAVMVPWLAGVFSLGQFKHPPAKNKPGGLQLL